VTPYVAQASPPPWLPNWSGLQDEVLGWALWQWLGLAVLLALSYLAAAVVRAVVGRLARVRGRLLPVDITDSTRRGIRRSLGLLGGVLVWNALLPTLGLSAPAEGRILMLIYAAWILGIVWFAISLWDGVCDTFTQRTSLDTRAERLLVPVTRKLVRFVIVVAGAVIALGTFGVNVAGLLATVGIGGLAVALAAKNSVENVFGSLTILFDMPFALGDWVKINNVEGIVEEINLRSTRIRTFDDSIVTLPNSNLISSSVENFGARRARRQRIVFRVHYDTPPDRIERFLEVVRAHLHDHPQVDDRRTVVELNEMNEPSLGVLVQCFFEADTFREEQRMRSELMMAILKLAREQNVLTAAAPRPLPPQPPSTAPGP
jgi:MscS family membrane protein